MIVYTKKINFIQKVHNCIFYNLYYFNQNVIYEQLVTGGGSPKKKKKYIVNDKRILKLVSNYNKNIIMLSL